MEIALKNTESVLLSFAYYKKLSPESRRLFSERVGKFIKGKDFEGRDGLEVTEEMKVIISASAIQLTFGLKRYKLKHFSKILIYPEKFYSPFSRSENVGEVNSKGMLVFSWKAIIDGLLDEHDSKNVALHEFAHALNLSDEMGVTTKFFVPDADPVFSNYFDKWYAIVRKLLKNADSEESKFFRKYAGKNLHEFFAVATEYFFEAPEEYKSALPELYYHHCCLLGQNPLNRDCQMDFSFSPIKKINVQPPMVFIPEKPRYLKVLSLVAMIVVGLVFLIILSIEPIQSAFMGFFFLMLFFNHGKNINLEIFEEKFTIRYKNSFFGKKESFYINSIISINHYTSQKNNPYLTIVSYKAGNIEFEELDIYNNFEALRPFFKSLFEDFNIVIKKEGRIIIP